MRGKLKKITTKLPSIFEITNVFGPNINDSLNFKVPISRVALNNQLAKQIIKMKNTAAQWRIAYLTANQVESFHRVFLLNRLTQDKKYAMNANNAFNRPQDFQVFINPEIVEGWKKEDVDQTCLTFPFLKFIVSRYQEVAVRYRDEDKTQKEEIYSGFAAQLIQHCIDHLNGDLILDYSLSKGRFYVQKDSAQFFPKTSFLLKEYSYRLKDYHQKPENQREAKAEQFLKMKADYIDRLKKQYEKQSISFSEKWRTKKPII